jgi:hypothetical protein
MNDPVALLNKVLEDNNLTISLSPMKERLLLDGSVLIEKPTLVVNFAKEVANEQPKQEGSIEGETVA